MKLALKSVLTIVVSVWYLSAGAGEVVIELRDGPTLRIPPEAIESVDLADLPPDRIISLRQYQEDIVRERLVDIQLGNVANYYRQKRDPDSREAVRRWDAGIRVANIDVFERKIVNGVWKITYRGTTLRAHGSEAILTTDARR